MRKLREAVEAAVIFVGAYLVFRYWAKFSPEQSGVLTLLAYFVVAGIRLGLRKEEFRPFHVSVQPNWNNLLVDYGWIKAPEDEKKYDEAQHAASLSFTFLKWNLIYSNYGKFLVSIPDFRLLPWDDFAPIGKPFVGFRFVPRGEG